MALSFLSLSFPSLLHVESVKMEKAKTSRPKRAPRNASQFFPLPVSVGTMQSDEPARHCTGTLIGRSVVVTEPADMSWLFTHGFYGKGTFSRSEPLFNRAHFLHHPHPQQVEEEYDPEEPELKKMKYDNGDNATPAQFESTMEEVMGTEAHGGGVPPPTENLQLCMEEAMFLCFGLGCLHIVAAEHPAPYSIDELWTRFQELKGTFVAEYAAYHHFRAKGWVTKTGIKYGVDWILYRKGPAFFHSE